MQKFNCRESRKNFFWKYVIHSFLIEKKIVFKIEIKWKFQ